MKKIFYMIVAVFLFIPSLTSAHTTLSSSTPSQGEIITNELHEVTLEFAGEIEDRSTFTITSSEKEDIAIESIIVEGTVLSGHISNPLKNGDYTLTWNIASTDGHLLTGDIPFTVNIPSQEQAEDTDEPAETEDDKQEVQEKEEATNEESNDDKTATSTEDEQTNTDAEQTNDSRSLISTISIIVLIILLAAGIGILFRKKR